MDNEHKPVVAFFASLAIMVAVCLCTTAWESVKRKEAEENTKRLKMELQAAGKLPLDVERK